MILRQLRIIYRQHLLPPFVLWADGGEIKRKRSGTSFEQLMKINETITKQLQAFRDAYILELKKCPCYFQMIDQRVKQPLVLNRYGLNDYHSAVRKLPIAERFRIYKNYKNEYKLFLNGLTAQSKIHFGKLTYVPLFIPQSCEQFAETNKIDYFQLSQIQRSKMRLKYINKFQQYQSKLAQIAKSQKIPVEQLFQLMRHQISPKIPVKVRELLLD